MSNFNITKIGGINTFLYFISIIKAKLRLEIFCPIGGVIDIGICITSIGVCISICVASIGIGVCVGIAICSAGRIRGSTAVIYNRCGRCGGGLLLPLPPQAVRLMTNRLALSIESCFIYISLT